MPKPEGQKDIFKNYHVARATRPAEVAVSTAKEQLGPLERRLGSLTKAGRTVKELEATTQRIIETESALIDNFRAFDQSPIIPHFNALVIGSAEAMNPQLAERIQDYLQLTPEGRYLAYKKRQNQTEPANFTDYMLDVFDSASLVLVSPVQTELAVPLSPPTQEKGSYDENQAKSNVLSALALLGIAPSERVVKTHPSQLSENYSIDQLKLRIKVGFNEMLPHTKITFLGPLELPQELTNPIYYEHFGQF